MPMFVRLSPIARSYILQLPSVSAKALPIVSEPSTKSALAYCAGAVPSCSQLEMTSSCLKVSAKNVTYQFQGLTCVLSLPPGLLLGARTSNKLARHLLSKSDDSVAISLSPDACQCNCIPVRTQSASSASCPLASYCQLLFAPCMYVYRPW